MVVVVVVVIVVVVDVVVDGSVIVENLGCGCCEDGQLVGAIGLREVKSKSSKNVFVVKFSSSGFDAFVSAGASL